MGGGFLNDDNHPRFRSIYATANLLAEKYAVSIDEILIAFLLKHPSGIIPVTGSSQFNRILSAKKAANIRLENEDWFKLWTASTGEDVP
jgi:predicted oxidoreductase